MWYMYKVEYYSAIRRNATESVLMRRLNLESRIQSEVSQKEKDKSCILMHKYGIKKDGTDDPICRAAQETQVYSTDFWIQWKKEGVR